MRLRMSSRTPKGANVQWTFGERTERPRARLTKCPTEVEAEDEVEDELTYPEGGECPVDIR